MSQFTPPDVEALKDKVVVLTGVSYAGGALGIGAELVRLCHGAGAHVFFGDVLTESGEALVKELSASSKSGQQHLRFVHTDVANYQSNLKLFDTAYETCGRIDHAASVAGIGERGNIVDPALTLESVREEPKDSMVTVDVNFTGPIYFSRIASVYLRQPGLNDKSSTAAADKSLTLVSSVAGFTEAPGLFVYSATKHGVYGLMRALRKVLIRTSPQAIRTNAICPWMTETRLVSGIEDSWHKAGLPRNTAMDVAKIIAGVMAAKSLNGEALGWARSRAASSTMDRTCSG
ncbi:hypothetical protein MBLNU459_g3262t2 [Dothideomycetes sp. NU459]